MSLWKSAVRPVVLAACAGAAWSACGQSTTSSGQPFDVNALKPGQVGSERPEAAAPAPEAADAPLYSVSRFLLEYRSEHAEHPSTDDVANARVLLGVVPEGYVAPGNGVPTTLVRIGDFAEGTATHFSAGALTQVAKAVVSELNARGLASVAVQIHPDDIDPATGQDKRAAKAGDLRLVVWTGVVSMVRTVASGERLEGRIDADRTTRVDSEDSVHKRIREQSPVQPGGLMEAKTVDDFLFRLNRHPGRRVDASVAPGAAEQEVVLDYMVTESKPWTVYGQLSNTGTKQTNDWRERVGLINNQLTGSDDILKFDFITSGFKESFAVNASYDFPLKSDELRAKIYASYNEFEASDVGLAGERFSGQTYGVGGELAYTVYQHKQLFIDLVGGMRFQSVKVDNEVFQEFGHERFLIPYVGARLERQTDVMSTFASLMFEYQHPDLANVDANKIQQLGRTGVSDEWQVLRLDISHSHYIEPLLSDLYWGTGPNGPKSLAHEVAASLHAQYSFNNRLIPNEQDVVGGFFTVRGYPESVAAGDSALVGSLEYRFHLPHALPVSAPGTWPNGKPGWWRDSLGENFRYAPSEAFGRTDWDLIFKAFIDAGTTEIASARVGENQQTLVGAGVGIEYQFKRFVTARLDFGVALNDIDDPANSVESGDYRLHALITVAY